MSVPAAPVYSLLFRRVGLKSAQAGAPQPGKDLILSPYHFDSSFGALAGAQRKSGVQLTIAASTTCTYSY